MLLFNVQQLFVQITGISGNLHTQHKMTPPLKTTVQQVMEQTTKNALRYYVSLLLFVVVVQPRLKRFGHHTVPHHAHGLHVQVPQPFRSRPKRMPRVVAAVQCCMLIFLNKPLHLNVFHLQSSRHGLDCNGNLGRKSCHHLFIEVNTNPALHVSDGQVLQELLPTLVAGTLDIVLETHGVEESQASGVAARAGFVQIYDEKKGVRFGGAAGGAAVSK